MEIAESIYKAVVEPTYKKPTWEDDNRAGCSSQKILESASSWKISEKGESSGKRRKRPISS